MATGRGSVIEPLKQLRPRDLAEQRKSDRLRCLKIMSQLAAMVESQMSVVRTASFVTAQINQAKELLFLPSLERRVISWMRKPTQEQSIN